LGAALVTTREGLEASLIVGIVLAYLAKTDNRQHFRTIWVGTAAAVLVSALTGAALFFTVGALEGRAEQIFEGVAMLSAVAVLTWMIFWMRKQAMGIKRELETVLRSGSHRSSSSRSYGKAGRRRSSSLRSARARRPSPPASGRSSAWSSRSRSVSPSTWDREG
jgi:FTR1 family protein